MTVISVVVTPSIFSILLDGEAYDLKQIETVLKTDRQMP